MARCPGILKPRETISLGKRAHHLNSPPRHTEGETEGREEHPSPAHPRCPGMVVGACAGGPPAGTALTDGEVGMALSHSTGEAPQDAGLPELNPVLPQVARAH